VTLALYMDHKVPRAITTGLRLRGIDVLTAFEDGASELDDSALLNRASELDRVLFTRDDDLLVEAANRQKDGVPISGLVYAHQLRVSIGVCVLRI
jgi:predicted nuclease of predicted toxin-antitoxin system